MISYQFIIPAGNNIDEIQLNAEFKNASFAAKFEDLYQLNESTIEAWFNTSLTVAEETEAQDLVNNHVPSMIREFGSLQESYIYSNGLISSIDYTDANGNLIKKDIFNYDSNNMLQSVTTEWYYGLSIVVITETKTITYDPDTGLISKIE